MDLHFPRGFVMKLLTFLSCLSLSYSNIVPHPSKDNTTAEEIAKMHSYMDTSINPCENFYEYSCGNWLKTHSDVINDPVNELDKIYNKQLEDLLDDEHNTLSVNDDDVLEKLKIFYNSCKEQRKLDALIHSNFFKAIGNEPKPLGYETWNPNGQWNAWQTLGELAATGYKWSYFSVSWKKDNTESYHLTMNRCSSQMLKDIKENVNDHMNQFEAQLNSLCERNSKMTIQKMKLFELQHAVPSIDFLAFFTSLFKDVALDLNSITLEIENLQFYKDFGNLVAKTSEDTFMDTMKDPLEQNFKEILSLSCIDTMRRFLPLALNYAYDKYVYPARKAATDEVVKQIFGHLQVQFGDILHNDSHEFSATERTFLNEKISQMQLNIGNLQLGVTDDFYSQYYRDWSVQSYKFHQKLLNVVRHKALEDLGVYTFLLHFSPTFENVLQVFYPFYLFDKNVIVVPFQYLVTPQFQPDLNDLLQYGDLGYSMSHALMYGFSPFGLQYNAAGERNVSFAEELLKKPPLSEALECLNPTHPYEDDIKMTDFIGFRLAYDTYFQQYPAADIRLDKELSNEQLFYLRYAQSECIVRRLPTYTDLPEGIQNTVNNGRDFEQAFGCEAKAQSKKCEIW